MKKAYLVVLLLDPLSELRLPFDTKGAGPF